MVLMAPLSSGVATRHFYAIVCTHSAEISYLGEGSKPRRFEAWVGLPNGRPSSLGREPDATRLSTRAGGAASAARTRALLRAEEDPFRSDPADGRVTPRRVSRRHSVRDVRAFALERSRPWQHGRRGPSAGVQHQAHWCVHS